MSPPRAALFWDLIAASDFPFGAPFPGAIRGPDITPNSADHSPRLAFEKWVACDVGGLSVISARSVDAPGGPYLGCNLGYGPPICRAISDPPHCPRYYHKFGGS